MSTLHWEALEPKARTAYDDADRDPPLRLLADIEWELVERDFRSLVERLLKDCRTTVPD